jgi:hypothetical protein
MNTAAIQTDFDEIARLSNGESSGSDRYDSFLLSLMPGGAVMILEVGCGGGRLTSELATSNRQVTDMRSDAGLLDWMCSHFAFAHNAALRFLRTGRPLQPRPLRDAWTRHCAGERYLTFDEARKLGSRLLPGATIFYHWLWRYTIVWDKPHADVGNPNR